MSQATRASRLNLEKYGSLLALVVLFILATIIGWPYFIQIENLTNVMRQASYTGIIALGMTFVIISGGIDLSVGAVAAFVASCGVLFMNYILARNGGNETMAIAGGVFVMVLLGGFAGALNGLLITKGKLFLLSLRLGPCPYSDIFRCRWQMQENLLPTVKHSVHLGCPKFFH
jgi:ribose transport system permease protein